MRTKELVERVKRDREFRKYVTDPTLITRASSYIHRHFPSHVYSVDDVSPKHMDALIEIIRPNSSFLAKVLMQSQMSSWLEKTLATYREERRRDEKRRERKEQKTGAAAAASTVADAEASPSTEERSDKRQRREKKVH